MVFRVTNYRVPDNLGRMVREISAGGVVVRRAPGGWEMAAIEPQKELSSSKAVTKTSQKVLLALPKGLVDPGEKPEQTAIREVREETGLTATAIAKLADIKSAPGEISSASSKSSVFTSCGTRPAASTKLLPKCASRSSVRFGSLSKKLRGSSPTGENRTWLAAHWNI